MADIEARDLALPEDAEEPTPRTNESDAQAPLEPAPDTTRPPGAGRSRRFVGSTPFLIVIAIAVAIVVKTFLIQAFYIPSASMVPTLQIGDRVFVNKLAYDLGDIGRGDVIVFANPNPGASPDRGIMGGFLHWLGEGIGFAQPEDEDFIKRVIGLPGETIDIRDNVVLVNGSPLDEPYLTPLARQANGDGMHFEVPAGSLFVMGDNRGNSADSRYGLGFVPVDKVIGKAFVVIWPPSDMGGLG
jgi:signal peptidase I